MLRVELVNELIKCALDLGCFVGVAKHLYTETRYGRLQPGIFGYNAYYSF